MNNNQLLLGRNKKTEDALSKKTKNALVPKWTKDEFGSFSLIFEQTKSTNLSKEVNNNQLKNLRTQKSKKSNVNDADPNEFLNGATIAEKLKLDASSVNCQPIGEKFYEYVEQQNELANGQYTNGDLSDTSCDAHTSENGASSSRSSADECNESLGSEDRDKCKEGPIIDDSDNNANAEDLDSDDDDAFADLMNQHFEVKAAARPTIVSTQTDSFPWLDDSEPIEKEVKFFIDKCRSTAMAEYDDNEYRIGYLDLTADERARMDMIAQTEIYLNIKSNYIQIRDNRLNIKRIVEREISPNAELPFESMYEQLGLGRVQFGTEHSPFFAKYQNEVYFVGHKLYHEYSELLKHTKKCEGTAIRIGHDRLIIDEAMQTLDILESIPFQNENEICVIPGSFDMYKFQDEYPLSGYQRFMICKNPWSLLEVEPELLHSSIYDDCTEIYADTNFPFADSTNVEKIVRPAKVAKQPKKPKVRYVDEEQLEMQELRTYAVPDEVKEYFIANEKKRRHKKPFSNTKFNGLLNKKTLRENVNDYVRGSKLMIHLEEEAQAHYLKRFDQNDIRITYSMDRQYYFPVTGDLLELAAAIEENVLDFFVLKPKSSINVQAKYIYGQVQRVRDKKIYLEIFQQSIKQVRNANKNEVYDICFILNRLPYQLQHYALDFIEKEELFTKLINNSYYKCKSAKLTPANRVPMQNKHSFQQNGTMLEKLNAEQQKTVKNIIGKVDKLPYVLFGPPGTGKTRTLVATIEQIVRTTKQNVLVCAMSNAACDEIAERLINVLDETEMYRFYAKSYKHERISSRIKRVSNYNSEGIFYPSLAFLYKFRVFICTLCSSGCLTRARKDKEVWRPNHFEYVIIDECASAHETMSLIPIAGVCTSQKQIHAKIVLAGDPKQLDAVTRSDIARGLGHNTSWMERLCSTNLYQRKNGKYNEMYITQLVKNYRSHPEILRIPNELFYENSLQACAKQGDINWYSNANFMNCNGFPLIFKAVKGECERSLEHSWFNETEVQEVYNTIKQLLPPNSSKNGLKSITQKDIGVVTPYRKQRHKISQKLRRYNLEDVTVGTAEIFQGKEKPIMIISTVRSNGKLGFVAEERRLNVVITRAKTLVVIIGDPHTLKLDKNWLRVIEHCIDHRSFIQCNKKFALH